MRVLSVSACLLLAVLLAACPAGRLQAPPPAERAKAQPAAPAAPESVASKLDVAGAMLGTSPALIGERYPAGGVMNVAPIWIEKDRRGMLGATMKDGSPSPAESAWFDGGRLVGFTRTTRSSPQVFTEEVARLSARFGAPSRELPDWARDSAFAKDYTKPGKDMQLALWGDRPGRALLLLILDERNNTMMAMLVDVDRYNDVSRELAMRYKPAPKPKPQI